MRFGRLKREDLIDFNDFVARCNVDGAGFLEDLDDCVDVRGFPLTNALPSSFADAPLNSTSVILLHSFEYICLEGLQFVATGIRQLTLLVISQCDDSFHLIWR